MELEKKVEETWKEAKKKKKEAGRKEERRRRGEAWERSEPRTGS
jgi:hypothetical protein